MKLKELLTKLEYKVVKGSDTIEVSHLQNDSRKVSDGDAVCHMDTFAGRTWR